MAEEHEDERLWVFKFQGNGFLRGCYGFQFGFWGRTRG